MAAPRAVRIELSEAECGGLEARLRRRKVARGDALRGPQPLLPLRPGQAERRIHDDKRCGTTSLFAALDVKAGIVIGTCMPRHRAAEFRSG